MGPHTVRLMPALDLSGHRDGPTGRRPSNRFAKPAACRSHGAGPDGGWDVRPIQRRSLRVRAIVHGSRPRLRGFITANSSSEHRDID